MSDESDETAEPAAPPSGPLVFRGGLAGALAPFALFLAGVAALALSGAPDERGFWPVLLAALALGLLLAKDREAYADAAVRGMSRPLVAVMILAWLLAAELAVSPRGLPMLLAPALVIALLLTRRHLLEGLFAGIAVALAVGLPLGLLRASEVLYVDPERFSARGLLVEGMERGVGVSIFTLLLMGLVGGLEATGVLERLVEAARKRATGARRAEAWIVGTVSAAVLLTTHSVVAILTVGDLARRTGERFGVSRYRRANLLDLTVCTWPFLLPYCIPTILAASTTAAGEGFGMPRISPLDAGLANLHSWALLAMVVLAVATGYGRRSGG